LFFDSNEEWRGQEEVGGNPHSSREARWFQGSAAQKLAEGSAVSRAAFPHGALGCGVAGRLPACAGRAGVLWRASRVGRFNSHRRMAESVLAGRAQAAVVPACLLPALLGTAGPQSHR